MPHCHLRRNPTSPWAHCTQCHLKLHVGLIMFSLIALSVPIPMLDQLCLLTLQGLVTASGCNRLPPDDPVIQVAQSGMISAHTNRKEAPSSSKPPVFSSADVPALDTVPFTLSQATFRLIFRRAKALPWRPSVKKKG